MKGSFFLTKNCSAIHNNKILHLRYKYTEACSLLGCYVAKVDSCYQPMLHNIQDDWSLKSHIKIYYTGQYVNTDHTHSKIPLCVWLSGDSTGYVLSIMFVPYVIKFPQPSMIFGTPSLQTNHLAKEAWSHKHILQHTLYHTLGII